MLRPNFDIVRSNSLRCAIIDSNPGAMLPFTNVRRPTTSGEENRLEESSPYKNRLRQLGIATVVLLGAVAVGMFLISRADGPVFVFAGGPLRSGEQVNFDDMNWTQLDALHELELEIVGAASSRTLWFSVHDGAPYVACDLDCIDGRLARWPQQIERDNRVVIRIDGRRVDAQLVHVPHSSPEYALVNSGRDQKYSGNSGGRAAAETASHNTVVEVGEILTGRAQRDEPGDRLYRADPR